MKRIIFLLAFLFSINFAYSLGCCVDLLSGTCSPNSEQSSCANGIFENDATCSSVSECDFGCCTIGLDNRYLRESSCYFLAESAGLEYVWEKTDAETCANKGNFGQIGACVIKTSFDTKCTYGTAANCIGGTFYQNLYCSNPSLNTTCKKTEYTTCNNESVHYLDTCGNIDEKKETCDYNQGTICTKKSSTESYCKNLNCEEYDKKNGERWCVSASGEGNVFSLEDKSSVTGKTIFARITGEVIRNGVKGKISESGLFLRNKENDNLNVLTGNAARSNEECAQQNAQQTQNSLDPNDKIAMCKAQASAQEGSQEIVYDPINCEVCDQSLDACGDNLCKRCAADIKKLGNSWSGRLNGCVEDNACLVNSVASPVGSRYFSQYCLNGEIFTEPCSDFRQEFCNKNTGGKCELNNYDICFTANELNNKKDSSNLSQIKQNCNPESCVFYNPSENKTLIKDLNLATCVPKITGGAQFWPTEEGAPSSQEDSECSLGNFEAELYLDHDMGDCKRWRLKSWEKPASNYIDHENLWGNAALFDPSLENWRESNCEGKGLDFTTAEAECNWLRINLEEKEIDLVGSDLVEKGSKIANTINELAQEGVFPNSEVLSILDQRCKALGDCDGKTNWIMKPGSSPVYSNFHCTSSRNDRVTCTFKFTCTPWKAPAGSESCKICGEDGLPCSEYRCEALGKGCDYKEPAGADKGYCVSSTDNTAPIINHNLNPQSPVPPFSSVEITISTNEESYCRFNLEESGSKFEDMDYEVDEQWSTEHKMILNVPGKKPTIENEDLPQYDLINDDGSYRLFVRCEDPAGNWNLAPYLINFEVMQTPDSVPPAIINFTPKSGSPVAFNTTQKIVQLKLNEPAECRWSSQDKEFLLMENNMSCDTDISDYGILNGYFCSTLFTNIDQNITNQTKYYIRCKDQPWLEGKEDEYYKRNTNPSSKEYFIRPSTQLAITDITPKDYLLVGPATTNLTLNARTEGGSESGRAECMWKFTINGVTTGYKKFLNTNSVTHSEIITNKTEGDYIFEVRCTDSAGNVVIKNQSLQMRYDSSAPYITRTYNDKGTLKIFTDEPAVCKFMKMTQAIDCLFPFGNQNATQMSGKTSLQHITNFVKGTTYLIKCQDFYSNTNTLCGITAKATS